MQIRKLYGKGYARDGFRTGQGKQDKKAKEYEKEINVCLINYIKAIYTIYKTHDCVNHVKLWNRLRKIGIPEHLIILM